MIVPDDVLWWTALGLGLFFTYEWLNFPLTTSQGAETGPGLNWLMRLRTSWETFTVVRLAIMLGILLHI